MLKALEIITSVGRGLYVPQIKHGNAATSWRLL